MSEFDELTWGKVHALTRKLAERIEAHAGSYIHVHGCRVYGVPRGGSIVAGLLETSKAEIFATTDPINADIIVDDIVDSGATRKHFKERYNKPFFGLVEESKKWVKFPWEEEPDVDVEENFRRILQFLGEDVNREGLRNTPKRYIKMLKELCTRTEVNYTTFQAEGVDEMIVQSDIPFYSLCEHHTAPFFGTGYIAYIPNDKIVGLSKLARCLQYYAKGFQNQERITQKTAQRLQEELNCKGVAVVTKARHMCMEMRGVKSHDTFTTASCLLGAFKDDAQARQEFLSFVQ
jgi:GTP cyclohydrolase I